MAPSLSNSMASFISSSLGHLSFPLLLNVQQSYNPFTPLGPFTPLQSYFGQSAAISLFTQPTADESQSM